MRSARLRQGRQCEAASSWPLSIGYWRRTDSGRKRFHTPGAVDQLIDFRQRQILRYDFVRQHVEAGKDTAPRRLGLFGRAEATVVDVARRIEAPRAVTRKYTGVTDRQIIPAWPGEP